MKNKNLKICFTIIMSFTLCSLKAQSIQQKFQKDMEARKKNVSTVVSKAKEQQAQQQAEKTSETNIPQRDAASNKSQPNIIQATTTQQKNTVIKPQLTPNSKRPLTVQKDSVNGPAKKEE